MCLSIYKDNKTKQQTLPMPNHTCAIDVICLCQITHPPPTIHQTKHLNQSPGKPELRDIYSIGLKTLIADVPEEVCAFYCVYIIVYIICCIYICFIYLCLWLFTCMC